MRRLLYIFFVACLIIGGILFVNYSKMNNLLFFATGTKEKAFLNTTWRMSPKEVERATGLTLLEMTDDERKMNQLFHDLYGPHIMNKNRFQELKQKNLFLWGMDAEVEYSFFDNQLYRCFILMKSGSALKDLHKTILTALEVRFGVSQDGKEKNRPDIIYSYKWGTNHEEATYWITQEGEISYFGRITISYLPLMSEIEQVVKDEQHKYF